MTHKDHINLITKAINSEKEQVWADFGSGWGAFTLALRDIIGEKVKIFSVDKNLHILEDQRRNFVKDFPNTEIQYINKSFTDELDLNNLDGILMANSLHYFLNKLDLLSSFEKYLKSTGLIIIIEYDTDRSNPWIPYPVSFRSLRNLVKNKFDTNLINVKKLNPINMYCVKLKFK